MLCDSNVTIIFVFGEIRIELEPKDYILEKENKCISRVKCSVFNYNQLPSTALRNKCVLYDYENRRFGLADAFDPRRVPSSSLAPPPGSTEGSTSLAKSSIALILFFIAILLTLLC